VFDHKKLDVVIDVNASVCLSAYWSHKFTLHHHISGRIENRPDKKLHWNVIGRCLTSQQMRHGNRTTAGPAGTCWRVSGEYQNVGPAAL